VIYDITEKQAEIRRRAIAFAREHIAGRAGEWDRSGKFPPEIFRRMVEEGLVAYPFPKEYGGMGGNCLEHVTLVEESARVDASAALVMCLNPPLVIKPILTAGTEEQKDKWLPPL
jgi:alkylation response protein AidB-like acyl-CoA dehydrogenase